MWGKKKNTHKITSRRREREREKTDVIEGYDVELLVVIIIQQNMSNELYVRIWLTISIETL